MALRTCLVDKFASFTGRGARSEFWWFALFILIAAVISAVLDSLLFPMPLESRNPYDRFGSMASRNYTVVFFALLTLVPALAAIWRRLHDSGRSALWLLLQPALMFGLLYLFEESGPYAYGTLDGDPFSGPYQTLVSLAFYAALLSPLILPWLLSRPSKPGPNKYGPNPQEVTP